MFARRLLSIVGLLALGTSTHADPCACNQLYVDPSVWGAIGISGLDQSSIDFDLATGYARNICRADGEVGAQFRIGALYAEEKIRPQGNLHYEATGFLGGELEASWALPDTPIRIGPRVLLAYDASGGDHTRFAIGGRMHYDVLSLGLEIVHASGPEVVAAGDAPSRTGLAVGAGLSLEPPRWLAIAGGVVIGIVLTAIVACDNTADRCRILD